MFNWFVDVEPSGQRILMNTKKYLAGFAELRFSGRSTHPNEHNV